MTKDDATPDAEQPAAATPAEDVKRKFREALDKKHAHGGRDVADDGENAKIHGAHGPGKAQQTVGRTRGGGQPGHASDHDQEGEPIAERGGRPAARGT